MVCALDTIDLLNTSAVNATSLGVKGLKLVICGVTVEYWMPCHVMEERFYKRSVTSLAC
jgi:hypothetical protein